MEHEINIYGDIVPFKWLNDGSEYDLKDLRDSLNSLAIQEGEELTVNIHTFGGDTTTAFGIYNTLRNFKQRQNIQLTTRVDGWCASSGVIILLAGDKRIGNKYAEPFIHNAWTVTVGDKEDHNKIEESLARVDDQIACLYAERTKIDKEKAMELMSANDHVNSEDALAYGFYTEFENVYSAENKMVFNSLRENNLQNRKLIKNTMSDKNKQSAWNKLVKDAEAFFKGVSSKNKMVFTADNSELDFYELNEDDTPAISNKAKFNGKPAGDSNNGKYVMASGETYRFDGEELIEIIAKTEDKADDFEAENKKLTEEIHNLKIEIQNLEGTNKEKDNRITTLSNQLSQSKILIKNFQNLGSAFDDGEDEGKREPKTKPEEKGKSRVSNALSKLKK